MTQRLAAICMAASFIVIPAGCGDAESEAGSSRVQSAPISAPKRDTGPRPTPDDRGAEPLLPGEYRSSVFRPELRFELEDKLWQRDAEGEDSLMLADKGGTAYDPEVSVIDVLRPWGVFDPQQPDNPDGRKWPRDMVRWLRRDSGLSTTAPRPAAVGGHPARRFDARVVRRRADSCEEGVKCVDLFVTGSAFTLGLEESQLGRFYVVDAPDEQRVIMLTVPKSKGPRAFAPLERVVRTMRFGA